MSQSCLAADLVVDAKCFRCIPGHKFPSVTTYLLSVVAGVSPNPQSLMAAASCFLCLNPLDLMRVQGHLLCQLALLTVDSDLYTADQTNIKADQVFT